MSNRPFNPGPAAALAAIVLLGLEADPDTIGALAFTKRLRPRPDDGPRPRSSYR
ncbi:hypothetical protein [Arthrobacter bambusae]|uniref:hypothetical protein n=1 Tax=Arthrobacter bambusae TaxID=1338426 RepID=UPI0027893B4B|nr:hypothetical protein [Arthrobacter bambusae]MDQ0028645.1 hypothetical protein [Arthrobacter bambusae]MDQ0096561.1 hypothetical protein [Arthrobacter bambusae]